MDILGGFLYKFGYSFDFVFEKRDEEEVVLVEDAALFPSWEIPFVMKLQPRAFSN